VFAEVVHAIPSWLLVILAVIGGLCILSTAALALVVAGLNAMARRYDAKQRKGAAHLQVVPSRDRIVQQRPRAGEPRPALTEARDPERVAPP
jgi:hypothetical protein